MSDGIDKCGPGWTSRYLWQGPGDSWVETCKAHDAAYTYRDIPRDVADRDLLHGMLLHSRTRWHRAVAWAYYLAVRAGGWALYYSGVNR